MHVRYSYEDDSRHKEGDLAREGYVHVVRVEGTHEECQELDQWCEEHIKVGYLSYKGSHGFTRTQTPIILRILYFKDSDAVFRLRLTWG